MVCSVRRILPVYGCIYNTSKKSTVINYGNFITVITCRCMHPPYIFYVLCSAHCSTAAGAAGVGADVCCCCLPLYTCHPKSLFTPTAAKQYILSVLFCFHRKHIFSTPLKQSHGREGALFPKRLTWRPQCLTGRECVSLLWSQIKIPSTNTILIQQLLALGDQPATRTVCANTTVRRLCRQYSSSRPA